MMKLPIGVVGVGSLGQHHARILSQHPDATLVGVYDVRADRAQKIAERYGTRAYPSLDALLEDVEAISCVVPTSSHYDVGKIVIEAGKHLFMEKPITRTQEEGQRLVDLAREKGVVLQVGHVERFNPAFLAVRDRIRNPRFMEIRRLARYNPRGTDVDVILDLMIHDLDLVLWLVEAPPVKVEALGVPVLTEKIDLANARITFDNGILVDITASRTSMERTRKLRVFKENLYASVNLLARDVELYIRREDNTVLPYFPMVDRLQEPLRLELESFVHSVLNQTPPEVSGEDGLRALKLALWIRREAKATLERIGLHSS